MHNFPPLSACTCIKGKGPSPKTFPIPGNILARHSPVRNASVPFHLGILSFFNWHASFPWEARPMSVTSETEISQTASHHLIQCNPVQSLFHSNLLMYMGSEWRNSVYQCTDDVIKMNGWLSFHYWLYSYVPS